MPSKPGRVQQAEAPQSSLGGARRGEVHAPVRRAYADVWNRADLRAGDLEHKLFSPSLRSDCDEIGQGSSTIVLRRAVMALAPTSGATCGPPAREKRFGIRQFGLRRVAWSAPRGHRR